MTVFRYTTQLLSHLSFEHYQDPIHLNYFFRSRLIYVSWESFEPRNWMSWLVVCSNTTWTGPVTELGQVGFYDISGSFHTKRSLYLYLYLYFGIRFSPTTDCGKDPVQNLSELAAYFPTFYVIVKTQRGVPFILSTIQRIELWNVGWIDLCKFGMHFYFSSFECKHLAHFITK